MTQDKPHLPAGTILAGGKYRIVRFIGAGGFGCTYEADFQDMDIKVAVKEFYIGDFCDRDATGKVSIVSKSKTQFIEKLKEKFVREAQRLFRLKHPNIVRVSDIVHENGTSYYIMDYISGHSLQSVIERDGPLPEIRAMRYIGQVMDALEYVHDKSMLHLDIKPENIMIDAETDQAILIDFGVSKQYDEVDGHNTSTIMGQTPGFSPPEQADNSIQDFTPASDIYAIGATLYCALTGCIPPSSVKLINGTIPLIPLPDTVSPTTKRTIDLMMQPCVSLRPQTIAAVRALFQPSNETVLATQKKGKSSVRTIMDPHQNTNFENGHEWVDMGTGVMWATCNIGASSPNEPGSYFAWGEISPKIEYTKKNSLTFNEKFESSLSGNNAYDAASAIWGGKWHLPRTGDFSRLIQDCIWKRDSNGGFMVKSKTTGNTIYFPASGYRGGNFLTKFFKKLFGINKNGYYWSGDCCTPWNDKQQKAYGLIISSLSKRATKLFYRSYGYHIRPVFIPHNSYKSTQKKPR